MATLAQQLFSPTSLTNATATYYTSPANTRTLIKKLTCTNYDTVARTVTIYLVPSGVSAGNNNILTKTATIAPAQTFEVFESEGHVLNAGGTIQALADANSAVNIIATGVQIF